MPKDKNLIPCIGCDGLFPKTDGPTYRYMESSPGCWAWYGEILAREYSDFRYGKVHRLTVDAYAVQHPGQPSPQSVQSVALHLMSLCAIFEKGVKLNQATEILQQAAKNKERFKWLTPPSTLGELTAADVHRAKDSNEHVQLVRAWTKSVWSAWSDYHETIRTWLSETRAV